MRYVELRPLRDKLYFTHEDLQNLLGIKKESIRVLCTRYKKNGMFIRLKKNLYILTEKWDSLSYNDHLRISNILQVPSYISLMTALSFYEITTQIQRNYYENISLKRTSEFNISGTIFKFYKIKKDYYFDFIKKDNIFIASPEKAFIDSIYLCIFKKYSIDLDSLNLEKLDFNKIKRILKTFPDNIREKIYKICRI